MGGWLCATRAFAYGGLTRDAATTAAKAWSALVHVKAVRFVNRPFTWAFFLGPVEGPYKVVLGGVLCKAMYKTHRKDVILGVS